MFAGADNANFYLGFNPVLTASQYGDAASSAYSPLTVERFTVARKALQVFTFYRANFGWSESEREHEFGVAREDLAANLGATVAQKELVLVTSDSGLEIFGLTPKQIEKADLVVAKIPAELAA